jgi:HEAT repeat protein
MSSRRTSPWLLAGLLALTLAPVFCVLGRAWAQEEPDEEEVDPTPSAELTRKRRAILAAITTNHAVLVNVTRADLPASPDVLNLGKKSSAALARCVSDNVDDQVRSSCAALLGRLGDRSSLPALQGALEAWNPSVRAAAISALRRIPDKSSFPALGSVLAREDETPDNRMSALTALGLLSDQRAVKVIRQSLRNEKRPEFRSAAFHGLWSSRHLLARTTLVGDVNYSLTSGDNLLVLPATYAAAELRDPGLVRALVPLMNNADKHVRNRAVYALGRIGDRAATSALLAQIPKVREARMLNNIAFALERLDPKAFFTAAKSLIGHKQAAIRMNAAFVLGDVRRSEGLPLLQKALDDQNDLVRVSTVAALGKLDAPEAIPLVERFVASKNRGLAKTAIFSLLSLSNGQKKDLVYDRLVRAPETDAFAETSRLEGALALARFGDARVLPDVLGCLDRRVCALPQVAGYLRSRGNVGGRLLLGWAKGRGDLTDLVGALRPAGAGLLAVSEIQSALALGNPGRAAVAMDLVGDVGEAQAAHVLAPLLRHTSTRLRLHAAVALSRAGEASADKVLFTDLDNLPVDQLPLAARLLGRVREPRVRERWKPELGRRETSSDLPVGLASAAVLLEWDPDAAFFRFLDALASSSAEERELGMRYLLRDRRPVVTALLRRSLAREGRPFVRDLLRKMLDIRAGSVDTAS